MAAPTTALKLASMEPWHFSHGEASPEGALMVTWYWLQWSHGILAMERHSHRTDYRTADAASMEPWHFSHGELVLGNPLGVQTLASMEPWHFSHGERYAHIWLGEPDDASMEPWHFSHGEWLKTHKIG